MTADFPVEALGYEPREGFRCVAEMPGPVLSLQGDSMGRVWALVLVTRRWWQFWKPPVFQKWLSVPIDR